MTFTMERGGDEAVKEQNLLKLSWYEFKLECFNCSRLNVISMITTKIIAREYTQRKWEKNLSISLPKNQLNTKKVSNAINQRLSHKGN